MTCVQSLRNRVSGRGFSLKALVFCPETRFLWLLGKSWILGIAVSEAEKVGAIAPAKS